MTGGSSPLEGYYILTENVGAAGSLSGPILILYKPELACSLSWSAKGCSRGIPIL